MTDLVTTNIRLPAEDYQKYRMIALSEGKSFAGWIRDILDKFISVQVITGTKEKVEKITSSQEPAIFNISKYKKWASGAKHDARDHDQVIYGL